MSTYKLTNISIKTLRDLLKDKGCNLHSTKGGHEHWSRKDLLRPITFSNHVNPVPEFVMQNCLRQLGMTKKDFIDWIQS